MTKCKGCVREKDNNESSCDMCFDFDLYESKNKKTNFDMCCESIENMAQIIDIAKVGWSKEQIIKWLQSEAE